MHDHARRFVDHGEDFILVNDIEWDIFRLESFDGFVHEIDIYLVHFPELVRSLDRLAVNQNVAVLDQPLQAGARPPLNAIAEKCIEPPAGFIGRNDDG